MSLQSLGISRAILHLQRNIVSLMGGMGVSEMNWKSANILFADVKGYSALSDKQMRIFTEKILGIVSDSIKNLSIRERNTWGDGIVLISDQIGDICEAALHLKDVFQKTNWKRYELPKLDIRISIHHGEYLEGNDPFTGRVAFCGRSVVTAARIEPVTPPGRIWMTQTATMMLTQHIEAEGSDYFAIDPIGEVVLPKKYGKLLISGLRRADDDPISPEEIKQIREAEQLRLMRDGPDRDQDLAEFIEKSKINSFHVVVGIVCHKDEVLLVKRHPNAEGLQWMFPSGKRWPTEDDEYVVEKEVMEETGIGCTVIKKIAEIPVHPLTGFRVAYFQMEPGDDLDVVNGDPVENETAEWVKVDKAIELIGKNANPSVVTFLREKATSSTTYR